MLRGRFSRDPRYDSHGASVVLWGGRWQGPRWAPLGPSARSCPSAARRKASSASSARRATCSSPSTATPPSAPTAPPSSTGMAHTGDGHLSPGPPMRHLWGGAHGQHWGQCSGVTSIVLSPQGLLLRQLHHLPQVCPAQPAQAIPLPGLRHRDRPLRRGGGVQPHGHPLPATGPWDRHMQPHGRLGSGVAPGAARQQGPSACGAAALGPDFDGGWRGRCRTPASRRQGCRQGRAGVRCSAACSRTAWASVLAKLEPWALLGRATALELSRGAPPQTPFTISRSWGGLPSNTLLG